MMTSAVGMFPNGASPYGVLDMSGNLCEWCLTNYNSPVSEASDENLLSDSDRVLRGGSWDSPLDYLKVVCRDYNYPEHRFYRNGFRVVSRPPSP